MKTNGRRKGMFSNYAAEMKENGIEFQIIKHSDFTKTEYKDEITMARFDSISGFVSYFEKLEETP